jgi:hypothetical protein
MGTGYMDECCDVICKSTPPPPPEPEVPMDLCSSGSDDTGDCKFMLNIRCADWRDDAATYNKAKQEAYLSQCMSQDCVQSLEPVDGSRDSTTGEIPETPGCRCAFVSSENSLVGLIHVTYVRLLWADMWTITASVMRTTQHKYGVWIIRQASKFIRHCDISRRLIARL